MTKKNTSSKKKLLPAAGMLALSAAMLSSATFAWFTMSREVEVKNIQMTATVPEDIQLSLGAITGAGPSANLANSTGFLTVSSGAVSEPGTDDFNWSNSADISAYYGFGKLIPASSTDGVNIYFTPDANGVGKTVKKNGKFYSAAQGVTAQAESTTGTGAGDGNLNTTAHAYTSADDKGNTGWLSGGDGNYTASSKWNTTNDDGYYVDIPVWLRTSSPSVTVGVQAYVIDVADTTADKVVSKSDTATTEGEKLYKAVRAAIINTDGTKNTGVLPVSDGDGTLSTAGDKYTGQSVVNYYTRAASDKLDTNANNGGAVASVASNVATYDTVTPYSDGTVATLEGGTGTEYGTAQKLIIRVWLEGEDPDCWNETSGQDWSINLKFVKK